MGRVTDLVTHRGEAPSVVMLRAFSAIFLRRIRTELLPAARIRAEKGGALVDVVFGMTLAEFERDIRAGESLAVALLEDTAIEAGQMPGEWTEGRRFYAWKDKLRNTAQAIQGSIDAIVMGDSTSANLDNLVSSAARMRELLR